MAITASERAEATRLARLSEMASRVVTVDRVLLVGIVAAGLVVRLVFNFGLVKVDPFTYADAAGSIVRGEPIYDPELTGKVYFSQYVRLSIIAPAALFYKLFGPSDGAAVAWPIAVSLATGPVAYWGGRMLSGRVAGLIAAAAVSLFPLNVINSTQFLPDVVQAAFAALAMVCFVAATEFPRTRRQRFWLYFAVGAGLAVSFYARATVAALLPPMALLVLLRRRVGPELFGGVLGGALVLTAAQVLIVWLGATPLEDIRVLRELSGSGITNTDLTYLRTFLTDRMFWPFSLFAGVGLALFAWRRGPWALYRSAMFPLLLFAAAQYVYFEFLMDLPDVVTWWEEPRYALPLVFALLVIGASGWSEAAGMVLSGRRGAAAATAIAGSGLLLVAAIPPVADEHDFYIDDGQRVDLDQIEIAKVVPEGATVYVFDDDFARPLSYRLGLAGTVYQRLVSHAGTMHNRLDPEGRSTVTPGSYVVILPREQWWPLATAAAAHWELTWESATGVKLYRVPDDVSSLPLRHGEGGTAWSVAWAVPQQHVVGEATLPAGVAGASIEVRWACGPSASPSRSVNVRPGTDRARFEIPFDVPAGYTGLCTLETPAGAVLGTLEAPLLRTLQAEDALTDGTGWLTASSPLLSAGWGAVAVPGSPAMAQLGDLPAGDYWVEMLVYDYGAGVNTVTVELNGEKASGSWGGTGEPGIRRVVVLVEGARAGGEIRVTVDSVGQDAALIDAVAVIDREPPESP